MKKILVVDDTNADSYARLLETMGFVVEKSYNGAMALEILKKEKNFALILSDFNMPVMDGIEFLNEIKKDKNLPSIPFIGMSADDNNIKDKFFAGGADDFFFKGRGLEVLLEKIEIFIK